MVNFQLKFLAAFSGVRFLAVLGIFSFSFAHIPWDFNGTTPSIKEIIIGRCSQYQELNFQNHNPALYMDVDCKQVWDLFNSSFAYKDSCRSGEMNESSYDPLFKIINSSTFLTDQALFWSGTRQIAHDYSYLKDSFFTLEDTFAGYITNGLTWCGCKNCYGGISYGSCNSSCSYAMDSYWSRASRTFAENAKGTAYVMLNGTSAVGYTAYYNKSYFGKIELPTLGRFNRITKLIVVVVNDLDKSPKESCGQGSLVDLVRDARNFGIKEVSCFDAPSDTIYLQCVKYPNAKQCSSVSDANAFLWKGMSVFYVACSVVFSSKLF